METDFWGETLESKVVRLERSCGLYRERETIDIQKGVFAKNFL